VKVAVSVSNVHRRARGAEIDQVGRPSVNHDIGWLDVAMQEARGMDFFEPVEQGNAETR
jgi:hypothetical protein